MRLRRLALIASFVSITLGLCAPVLAETPSGGAQVSTRAGTDAATAKRVAKLKTASKELKALARAPRPDNLTPAQETAWDAYVALMTSLSAKVDATARTLPGASSQEQEEATELLQLDLQDAMSKKQQALQVISAIMKKQSETAQSIIDNLR